MDPCGTVTVTDSLSHDNFATLLTEIDDPGVIFLSVYVGCSLLVWQPGLLVEQLACLLLCQKAAGSLLKFYFVRFIILTLWDIFQWCCKGVAWLSRFVFIVIVGTFFQIEREECNIPISIGRVLVAWLAARAFSYFSTIHLSSWEVLYHTSVFCPKTRLVRSHKFVHLKIMINILFWP